MNTIKLGSDVKLDECEGCKIWSNRYNTSDKCPNCTNLDIETVWNEFEKAFNETFNKE
jgi:hypothetical protein